MFICFKKQTWKRAKGTAAETLAEIIIAIIVLSVGVTGAMTLVTTAINANAEAEERIEAYNFAREGVEIVRSMRDTNWLRFPGDRADCWDVEPAITDPADCPTAPTLGSAGGTDYIVYPNVAVTTRYFSWEVRSGSIDPTICEETVGSATMYKNDTGSCSISSPFSRIVNIVNDGSDTMEISSTVTWDWKGNTRSVTFADELTNY